MLACVDELSEVRTSQTAAIPFQIGRHRSSFRCSYDWNQCLLSSSPPEFGFDLWKKALSTEPRVADLASYGSNHQVYSSLYKDGSVRGDLIEKEYILVQNANRSSADVNVQAEVEKKCHDRVKKVSFADDYGFQLTEIKYFVKLPDQLPIVKTKSMAESIRIVTLGGQNPMSSSVKKTSKADWLLIPDFPMPISNHAVFSEKVDRDCVSLESLYVTAEEALTGIVRVKNLAFHKRVFVRCSFDAWKTSTDVACAYLPDFYPGALGHSYDRFSFTLNVPPDFDATPVEFAVCYQCDGREYWDSNSGANYHLISPTADWFLQDRREISKIQQMH